MEAGCIDSSLIDLGTNCRSVVSLKPGRFIPGERYPGARCIRGRVGPSDGLDDMKKWKISILGLELQLSVVQPVASCYTDCSSLSSDKRTELMWLWEPKILPF
jgi:hypothetical protein